MARRVGMETEELLKVLENWKQQGKLRRIGAIVNHFAVGLAAGAMVVWRAEPRRVDEVGTVLAGFEEVSHAYERHTAENWPYNIYTMVHSANVEQLQRTIERMSEACGVTSYRALVTAKELKKTAPTYVI
jgi:DNA-binding Lrp family transcriptional regulator